MKKSKLFLGVTSLCLAIAAIAATKANSRAAAATSGYTNGSAPGLLCTHFISNGCFTSGSVQCTSGVPLDKPLFKKNTTKSCETKVWKS